MLYDKTQPTRPICINGRVFNLNVNLLFFEEIVRFCYPQMPDDAIDAMNILCKSGYENTPLRPKQPVHLETGMCIEVKHSNHM